MAHLPKVTLLWPSDFLLVMRNVSHSSTHSLNTVSVNVWGMRTDRVCVYVWLVLWVGVFLQNSRSSLGILTMNRCEVGKTGSLFGLWLEPTSGTVDQCFSIFSHLSCLYSPINIPYEVCVFGIFKPQTCMFQNKLFVQLQMDLECTPHPKLNWSLISEWSQTKSLFLFLAGRFRAKA